LNSKVGTVSGCIDAMSLAITIGLVYLVKLTILIGLQKKCARYWPEYDGSMTFDDMTITLKLTESWPNYVIRHLQLVKVGL